MVDNKLERILHRTPIAWRDDSRFYQFALSLLDYAEKMKDNKEIREYLEEQKRTIAKRYLGAGS